MTEQERRALHDRIMAKIKESEERRKGARGSIRETTNRRMWEKS